MEQQEPDGHVLRRWFSIGDIFSGLAMLAALAASYGSLSSRLDNVAREVQELRERDITPGARTEIATMRARDDSQDRELAMLREELRSSRREITESLVRLEAKLDTHDRERP